MVNSVHLLGRLGADPELRHTQTDKAVCNLRLATDGYNGETEWHAVVAWGKQAEFCSTYLRKGAIVFIGGRLQTRSWEDKDGGKRYKTEVVAHTVQAPRLSLATPVDEPDDTETDVPF